MVTHVHVSKFRELIPIMISHIGSIHAHLNHTTFILSYAFGYLTSKNCLEFRLMSTSHVYT